MSADIPGLELLELPPAGDRLVRDYHDVADALAPFYAGSPSDPQAYIRKLREVDARFDDDARAEAVGALQPAGDAARRQLGRVASERGVLVTTGQQPGLFCGPLYTIYKALTAVRLAEALEPVLERPVLAVFWVASEDHDLAEVDHTWLIDGSNELRRVGLGDEHAGHDGRQARGASMAYRRLGAEVDAAVAAMRELLPDSDFRDPLLEDLTRAYRQGHSVADAFAELLARLLRDQPIALVQASDPVIKQRSTEVLRYELEHGVVHAERLRATARALEASGYPVQVPILPDAENVFHEDESGRERLLRDGDGWKTRRGGVHTKRDALLRELDEAPGRFSPNVLLRPVVESAALPTVAYVGGPAELRYFAEIGCLFEAHGIGMPVFKPRASFAVVESKVRKVLDKFELDLEALQEPAHEMATRLAAQELPAEVRDALAGLKRDIGEGYATLEQATRLVDPTLKAPMAAARTASLSELGSIEKRVLKHLKEKNAVTLAQVEKARVNLVPDGRPQERVLNPYQYLTRYGPDFIDTVAARAGVELRRAAEAWAGVECGASAPGRGNS